MSEQLSLYKRRIAQGLCGMCGKNPIDPSSKGLCTEDMEKSRQSQEVKRAKTAASAAEGKRVCLGCQKPIASGTRCDKCKAEQKVSRDKHNALRKEAGLCITSAKHGPAKEGCVLCQTCIDKRSVVSSVHYRRRKEAGLCYYGNHPPEKGKTTCAYHTKRAKDTRFAVKIAAFDAYGGPQCSWPGCDCCDPDMLHLDHIDSDGASHRKELGAGSGHGFYQKLRSLGYPQEPQLRVLCSNHNTKAYANYRKKGAS